MTLRTKLIKLAWENPGMRHALLTEIQAHDSSRRAAVALLDTAVLAFLRGYDPHGGPVSLEVVVPEAARYLNVPMRKIQGALKRLDRDGALRPDGVEGRGVVFINSSRQASRLAKDIPKDVERYVQEHKDQGADESKAWALAWSRFCKYKSPGSPHCKQDGYFKGKKAALVGTDTATVYALAPESLKRLIEGKVWIRMYGKDDFKAADKLIREHGGAVFSGGLSGKVEVKIPDAMKEGGFLPPWGTKDYHKGKKASGPFDTRPFVKFFEKLGYRAQAIWLTDDELLLTAVGSESIYKFSIGIDPESGLDLSGSLAPLSNPARQKQIVSLEEFPHGKRGLQGILRWFQRHVR